MQDGIYRSVSGKEIKLDLNKENVVHQLLGGEMYTTDNKVNYCQGSDPMVHGKVMDNVIVFQQLKIRVRPSKIVSQRNKR